jgi:PKHD-type hydroxylase
MLTNHYWYVPEALTQQQCDDIQHAASNVEQVEGFHFGHDENHRTSQISWLYDRHATDLIAAQIRQANIEAGWRYDLQAAETVQYTRYQPQGYYRWHIDGNQDHHAARKFLANVSQPIPLNVTPFPEFQGLVRKLSGTVNLSHPEDYEGGQLQIRCYDRLHIFNDSPRGSMVIFPSFMEHQVTAVTSGERHAAVMWYNGYPLR